MATRRTICVLVLVWLASAAAACSDGGGGGVFLDHGEAVVERTVILSNAADYGGGVFAFFSSLELINGVVAGNTVGDYGGSGVYLGGASARLTHTTIAGNSGGDGSGVMVRSYGPTVGVVTMTNSIVAGHGVGVQGLAGAKAVLESTLWVGNGTESGGEGEVVRQNDYYADAGDPLFVDPGAGDYHLVAGAAAIDRGVTTGVVEDLDGEPRPVGPQPDLGADEYPVAPPTPTQ